jgi:hypothetical protein
MNAIEGIWKNGQIIPDEAADWPEGCRVRIEPLPEEEKIGLSEDEWPTTPEAIADWLKWIDSFEPVELTPEDEANWAAWRQEIKDYTITNQDKHLEGLFA